MIANLDLSVVWRDRSQDGLFLVFKALFYHDEKRHTTQWQCYFTSGLYYLSSTPLLGSPLSLCLVKSWKTRRTARAPLKKKRVFSLSCFATDEFLVLNGAYFVFWNKHHSGFSHKGQNLRLSFQFWTQFPKAFFAALARTQITWIHFAMFNCCPLEGTTVFQFSIIYLSVCVCVCLCN